MRQATLLQVESDNIALPNARVSDDWHPADCADPVRHEWLLIQNVDLYNQSYILKVD